MTLGDMWACVAALRVGERRFQELCAKHGKDTVLASIDKLLDDGDRLTRAALARLPKGTYEAEDMIDDDGIGNGPFPVRVKVSVSDDQFVCDFTGSHPQVPGPVNSSHTALVSAVCAIYLAITNPSHPVNDGAFRSLETMAAAERIAAIGFAMPLPAMSGAVPWTGS